MKKNGGTGGTKGGKTKKIRNLDKVNSWPRENTDTYHGVIGKKTKERKKGRWGKEESTKKGKRATVSRGDADGGGTRTESTRIKQIGYLGACSMLEKDQDKRSVRVEIALQKKQEDILCIERYREGADGRVNHEVRHEKWGTKNSIVPFVHRGDYKKLPVRREEWRPKSGKSGAGKKRRGKKVARGGQQGTGHTLVDIYCDLGVQDPSQKGQLGRGNNMS